LKRPLQILLILLSSFVANAQNEDCIFNKAVVTIHFGTGNVREVNSQVSYNYDRVAHSCPTDGHYTYTSYTSDCFRGDWHTLTEDHTAGDANGNMMLVNGSPRPGTFLTTNLPTLKPNTIYEFGVWMMNVCKPSDKCPFPLLPNIIMRLVTPSGKVVSQLATGDLTRLNAPQWTQYKIVFTTPAETDLILVMANNSPGGCGNDFALDDITLKECEKPKPVIVKKTTTPAKPPTKSPVNNKPKPPVVAKAKPAAPPAAKPKPSAPVAARSTPANRQTTAPKPTAEKAEPERKPLQTSKIGTVKTDTTSRNVSAIRQKLPPPPVAIATRANPVIKRITAVAANIRLDLYDNGQIDGDTVSIYHNNRLIVSRQRISQKPITFYIPLDEEHPHHELVMVAENLGSIPPNTSLMIVTAGSDKHEVFISSTEQKNAKIVIELKR
jgi:hypothetical protein